MNLTTDSTWAWRLSCSPILWMDVHSGEIKCQPKNISWFLAANLTFKFGRQTSQHFVWKLTRSFYNIRYFCCCCLVAKSCLTLCNLMDYSMPSFPVPHHLLEFAQTHVHWIGDAIQTTHPFLLLPSIFPSIRVFSMSWLFTSDGQNIGVSASASVLLVNIQGLFPLGLIDLISLLSKGLSRVFSSTTVWKHQFFGTQLSLQSNSYIHTWLLEKS